MNYPLVPLINDLTFPFLFFWFCLPLGILLILLIFWFQHLLDEAEVPITKEIKMSPRDDPDGNIDLKSEHESSGNNSQNKYRKALKFDMKMTPVVEKLGFRSAHSGSKETEKSLSACISRQLDQYGRQYCSEKNFMHNTPVPSSPIV
ncbi:adipogenin [Crotalus tigris]|uniref:adipogenin n=1 Tax=Crotalus tigris TaxID=88082 RepID=UPI00192F365B|nr:adipogenin [Crotalus tigris]